MSEIVERVEKKENTFIQRDLEGNFGGNMTKKKEETKEIAVVQESSIDMWQDSAMLQTLKKTVAQGATDEEFVMFSELCKATGLNPFKKEVWFIKAGGRAQIMTGINGYLAVANKNPAFDGMEVDVQVDNSGAPIKATAKVYRKDRKYPSVGIALMKEFKKGTPIWNTMPSVMLTKVAKSIALREAFPQELNGLYTEEEMPPEYSLVKPDSVIEPKKEAQKPAIDKALVKATREAIENDCAYKYPRKPLSILPKEQKVEIWNFALSRGAVVEGDSIYCAEELPDIAKLLTQDELPESFGEVVGEGAQ